MYTSDCLDLKHYQHNYTNWYYCTPREQKPDKMQASDDLQLFFRLIVPMLPMSTVSSVPSSPPVNSLESPKSPSVTQSRFEQEGLESSLTSKSSVSNDSQIEFQCKESESSEMSCEWMFYGFWYFQNEYGLLPDVGIQDYNFQDTSGKKCELILGQSCEISKEKCELRLGRNAASNTLFHGGF